MAESGETRLLIAHDAVELYSEELRRRFPDLAIEVAGDPQALGEAIARFCPTIAYSCVTHGFARHHHRQLVDCPTLRWLHVGGSGFEHLGSWDPARLTVSNGQGVLAPFLADMVMGAIIALAGNFAAHWESKRTRHWTPRLARPLEGRRLLVVGTGAIGRALAKRAVAHGLEVVGITRRPRPLDDFTAVEGLEALPALAASCDIMSLHLRLTEATRRIVDADLLARMKPEAILVNTGRGGLVDEAALIAALRERRLAGAYLDVFETEPLPESSPLWGLENVMITPHCADQVVDWQERHARFFMDNLERRLEGRPLLNVVEPG